jgi:DNA-binding MarR family transcriptional regulator
MRRVAHDEYAAWAEAVAADLGRVRRLLRQRFAADLAHTNLTAPQISLLSLLADNDGQRLDQLSQRLHLSHSTVSGIVDRLAGKGLVERRTDARDRRVSRIWLTPQVAAYTEHTLPAQQHAPLARVAHRATPDQQAAIRAGLQALRHLLEQEIGQGGAGRRP